MLHKTKGVVLNYIKYKETSIIVKIFTEGYGLNSYIVNGVRSAKSKNQIAFYQPLTLLDMVVYENKKSGLKRISEVKCSQTIMDIPSNIKKSAIGLFITEMLIKCIKGEEQNSDLFNFLEQSILVLEHLPAKYANFHLQFLMKLSRFLGFAPQSGKEIEDQLMEAGFKHAMLEEEIAYVNQLIEFSYDNDLQISNQIRKNILTRLIQFYSIHIETLEEIKSIPVLNAVLS